MSNDSHRMKSIKVSEEVHSELSTRKHGGESFDEVLKRELGLVPRTIEELTRMLPRLLRIATNTIVRDHVDEEESYKRIGHREEQKISLEYISRDTNKTIYEVVVFPPNPTQRINHRVDIRYRNPQNELERIGQLRNVEDTTVDIEYTDFDTREVKETTRRGDNAGQKTAEKIGPHVSRFTELAHDVWGATTKSRDTL